MKDVLIAITLRFPVACSCQFYYNDILDARLTGEKMSNFVKQKVKLIVATGYDANGVKTTDFNERQ